MKRALVLALAVAALMGFSPAPQAQAAVSVGFSVGGRHSGFSLGFNARPDVVLIPSSTVYYAPDLDEDLYYYGGQWFYCDDGSWFVADSYDGPFFAVAFDAIPFAVRDIPVFYRRHWGGYAGYRAPAYRQPYVAPSYSDFRDRSFRDRNFGNRNFGDRNSGNRNFGDRNVRSFDRNNRDVSQQPRVQPAPRQAPQGGQGQQWGYRTWSGRNRGNGSAHGNARGNGNDRGNGRWGR